MAEIEKSIEVDRSEFLLTILDGELIRHNKEGEKFLSSWFMMGLITAMTEREWSREFFKVITASLPAEHVKHMHHLTEVIPIEMIKEVNRGKADKDIQEALSMNIGEVIKKIQEMAKEKGVVSYSDPPLPPDEADAVKEANEALGIPTNDEEDDDDED